MVILGCLTIQPHSKQRVLGVSTSLTTTHFSLSVRNIERPVEIDVNLQQNHPVYKSFRVKGSIGQLRGQVGLAEQMLWELLSLNFATATRYQLKFVSEQGCYLHGVDLAAAIQRKPDDIFAGWIPRKAVLNVRYHNPLFHNVHCHDVPAVNGLFDFGTGLRLAVLFWPPFLKILVIWHKFWKLETFCFLQEEINILDILALAAHVAVLLQRVQHHRHLHWNPWTRRQRRCAHLVPYVTVNRGCEPGGSGDHCDPGWLRFPYRLCNNRHERLDYELGLESEQHGVCLCILASYVIHDFYFWDGTLVDILALSSLYQKVFQVLFWIPLLIFH